MFLEAGKYRNPPDITIANNTLMEKFILELCSCQLLVTGRQVFINRNFREINVQSRSFAVGAK